MTQPIETDSQFRTRSLPYLMEALDKHISKDVISIIQGYVSLIDIEIYSNGLDNPYEEQKHLVNYIWWEGPLTMGYCDIRGSHINVCYSVMEKFDFEECKRVPDGEQFHTQQESIKEFLSILDTSRMTQFDAYTYTRTILASQGYYCNYDEDKGVPFSRKYAYFHDRYKMGQDVIWIVKSQLKDLLQELQYIVRVGNANNVLFHWV